MALTLRRQRRSVAMLAAFAAAASWLVSAPATGRTSPSPTTAVVDPALRAAHGTVGVVVTGGRAAESAVLNVGGHITYDLPIIGGFAAKVPANDIGLISRLPGVRSVALDAPMQVMGALSNGGGSTGDVYKAETRANDLQKAGYAGQGVTVALIDTGVAPLPDVASRLVQVTTDPTGLTTANCVNFSGDGSCTDYYGHGTFLAGLIAGTGASSNGQYVGAAPQARIVSVKIAGATGASDVSNVIAALQWVIAFKNVYGINVLNLSLGTNGTQSYMLSPLDFAVEKAWQAGITVLVSASNLGPAPGTIDKPADDPYVITVGAVDDEGTPSLSDDGLPSFSAHGPTAADGLAKPDITAPGAHLVSLAAPGAAITTQFPPNMPAPYRRGSGTSMSTAVVSGIVADILSAHPTWTPDRVKFALMSTARAAASSDVMAVGSGVADAYDAAFNAPAGLANQGITPGTGLGSIQADRGSVSIQLADASGNVTASPLSGEVTAQLTTYDPTSMLLPNFDGNSWYGNSWYGNSWYAASWLGNSWYGNSWYGNSWYGNSWYGNSWYGNSWYGNSWYGAAWYGAWDQ